MSKVVTANALATGTVVFLDAQGSWTEVLAQAASFDDPALADAALEAAKRDEARAVIVDPFIVDRKDDAEGSAAMTLRNAIRAHGPTIDYRPAVRPSSAA